MAAAAEAQTESRKRGRKKEIGTKTALLFSPPSLLKKEGGGGATEGRRRGRKANCRPRPLPPSPLPLFPYNSYRS